MRALLLWTCLVLLLSASASAAVKFETIAEVGDPAPDSGGGTYSVIVGRRPMISTAGHVYFDAGLDGSSFGSTVAAFAGSVGNTPVLVVRNQAQVPDLPSGTLFFVPGSGAVNASGTSIFPADLTGSATTSNNNGGLFIGPSLGALATVYQKGTQAPGLPAGITFGNLFNPRINNAGQAAFRTPLLGSANSNDAAVWLRSGGGTLSKIARVGEVAPGTSSTYATMGVPALNGGGTVAFGASLASGGGIWYGSSAATLTKLASTGDPVPGVSGVTFLSPGDPRLSSNGRMVFNSTLGGSVTSTNDRAIFAGTSSANLQIIAREGQAAPGTEPGVTFSGFLNTLLSGDQVVFRATLAGTSFDSGIWSGTSAGDLALIARENDSVPGLDPAYRIGDFVDGYNANGVGQIVFNVWLTGSGLTSLTDDALLYYDPAEGLNVLVRGGDMVDVDGVLRELSSLNILNGEGAGDGAFTALNDQGQLAVHAFFTDGTEGVYVLQVPEPASVAGLVLLSMLTLSRRRR